MEEKKVVDVTNVEMLFDIQKMLLVVEAFTKPNTQGETILKMWQEKYRIRWNQEL